MALPLKFEFLFFCLLLLMGCITGARTTIKQEPEARAYGTSTSKGEKKVEVENEDKVNPIYLASYRDRERTRQPYVTSYGATDEAKQPYITGYGATNEAKRPYITGYGATEEAKRPHVIGYGAAEEAKRPYITGYGAADEAKVTSYGATEEAKQPYITSYGATEEAKRPYITAYGATEEAKHPYVTSYGATNEPKRPYVTGYGVSEESKHPYITSYGATDEAKRPYITGYGTIGKAKQPYITRHGATNEKKRAYGATEEAKQPCVTGHGAAEKAKRPYITGYGATQEAKRPYITGYGVVEEAKHPYVTGYGATDEAKKPYITSYGTTKETKQPYITSYGVIDETKSLYTTSYGATDETNRQYITSYRTTDERKGAYITSYGDAKENDQHPYKNGYGNVRETSKDTSKQSVNGDAQDPRPKSKSHSHAGVNHMVGHESLVQTQPSSDMDRIEAFKVGFCTIDDLSAGKIMPLYFSIKDHLSRFLPREVAESIPFSMSQLPNLLQLFSIQQGSPEAKEMELTLRDCEQKPINGETKLCATSLESMVEFARRITGSGENFKLLSTTHPTMAIDLTQNYTILEAPKQIMAPKMVFCHPVPYPYAVFFCHFFATETKVIQVALQGESGDDVEAIVVCHVDTSNWDPNLFVFSLLGVKPGTSSPVCHFLPKNHLVWIPSPTTATA